MKILLIAFLCNSESQAQYIWEEVFLPDSLFAWSICFHENGIYLSGETGVYYSDDNCESWQYIGLGQYLVRCIHFSKTNNLYAGIHGIFRYTGNNQWEELYIPSEITPVLSLYESDSGYIFFGNWGGIFRSVDNGISWNEVLDLYNTEVVNTIIEDSNGILYAGITSWVNGLNRRGVYRSEDGGSTWISSGLKRHSVTSIVFNSKNEIFAGDNGGLGGSNAVHKSLNNGHTWQIIFDNHPVNSMDLNEYDDIAIACEDGIFCSYNDGQDWVEVTPSWIGGYFEKIAFSPQNQLYTIYYYPYGDLYRTIEPVFIKDYSKPRYYEVELYPNPSYQRIKINTESVCYSELRITDLTGNVVKCILPQNKKSLEIDISDLPSSVYLLHCIGESMSAVVKFVKL